MLKIKLKMKALDSPLRLFVLFGILLLGISGCNNQVTDPINDKEYPAYQKKIFPEIQI